MNKKQYNEIKNFFNKILRQNISNSNFIGLSFLHFLRPQKDIIDNFLNFNLKYRFLHHIKFSLHKFLAHFFLSNKNEKIFKSECVILSHLTNIKNLNINNDFYFGKLEEYLKKNKKKTIKIFRNLTKIPSKQLNITKKNICIIDDFDSFANEIKFLILSIKEYLNFKFQINCKQNIPASCKKYFSFFNFLTLISNLRLCRLVLRLVNMCEPRYFFITLEGHAWEKILIYNLRLFFPKIQIIGYQFSILSKYSNSIFLKLGHMYEPDYILTKNIINKKFFIKKKFNVNKVKVVGDLKNNKKNINKKNGNAILICPEALNYETEKMYNFAISAAKQIKNRNFIFRPHPSFCSEFNENISNLIISKNTLNEDLKISSILIYRGSSVCFDALHNNILPVYLYEENELNIDPIYKIQFNCFKIKNSKDLYKLICNLKNLSNIKNDLLKKGKCYFSKPNLKLIKKITNGK